MKIKKKQGGIPFMEDPSQQTYGKFIAEGYKEELGGL
jgi:hypothetical protein